jgi:hypothetical protein
VHTYSKAPFRDEWMHWAGVLMLQRLLTVVFQSLSTEAFGKSLGVTAVSFISALLQVHARPFRSNRVNQVQLMALVCLTFISMLSGAQAAFETAGVDTSKAPVLAAIIERADWMMCVLLLLPPLLFMLPMDLRKRCGAYLCKHGAGDEGDEERNRALDAASAGNQTLERQLQQAQQRNEQLLQEKEREKEQLLQEKEQLLQEKEQEKEQLLQEKEQEKEQLLQEKAQEMQRQGQRHEQEKEQLQQDNEELQEEKEQLQQDNEELKEEKEQLQQDNDQLLARLEDQQEPGEQRAATAARRDVYRTFDPAGQEGQGEIA